LFPEDTEVIDFFAPPRDDFLLGGKPAYMGRELNLPAQQSRDYAARAPSVAWVEALPPHLGDPVIRLNCA
jgi:hypothetical protein